MANGVPKNVSNALNSFQGVLSSVEVLLQDLWDIKKELEGELQPLETARLSLAMSTTAATLFGMYLKTRAVPTDTHPVKKELERLQLYEAKVGRAISKQKGPKAPTASLDVVAANRFIDHAIPDLTPEQRQRLQRMRTGPLRSKDDQQRPSKRSRLSAADSAKAFLEKAKAELEAGPQATAESQE